MNAMQVRAHGFASLRRWAKGACGSVMPRMAPVRGAGVLHLRDIKSALVCAGHSGSPARHHLALPVVWRGVWRRVWRHTLRCCRCQAAQGR
jgi:hypothetical protein